MRKMKEKTIAILIGTILVMSLMGAMSFAAPDLTDVTATPSDSEAGATTSYIITFRPPNIMGFTSVEMVFPPGFDVGGVTLVAVTGGPVNNAFREGSISGSGQVVAYAFNIAWFEPSPMIGMIEFSGIINTIIPDTEYAVMVKTSLGGPTASDTFEITAVPDPVLTLNIVGEGWVSWNDIYDTSSSGVFKLPTNTMTFDTDTEVRLIPLATIGWTFDHWDGEVIPLVMPSFVKVTLDEAKTVTVTFTMIPPDPMITLLPDEGFATTIAGEYFRVGETVIIQWTSTTMVTIPSRVIVESDGTFVAMVTALDSTDGIYTISASDGVLSASADFIVTDMKGDTGLTGSAGPQGDTGIDGEPGSDGIDGEPGSDGAPGTDGRPGDQGIQGERGQIGETGPNGRPGVDGEDGDKGDTGLQGIQGEDGDKGDTGEQGIQGVTGDTGLTGATGATGSTGPAGADGSDGATGATGSRGPEGDRGSRGLAGATGLRGIQGATGEQGLQGDVTGLVGPEGPQGIQGVLGYSGVPGTDGEDGATGLQGLIGDTGLEGLQGEQGETGEQGPKGTTGPQGEPGSTTLIYGGIALGGISLLGVLYALFGKK